MSLSAIRWAFGLDIRPATTKFVLVAMADRADSKGWCWPSVQTLCLDTSANRKTVMAAIARLEEIGVIEVVRHEGTFNKYHLAIGDIQAETSPKNGTGEELPTSPENGTGQNKKLSTTSTNLGTTPVPKTVPHQSQNRDTNLSRTDQEPNSAVVETVASSTSAVGKMFARCAELKFDHSDIHNPKTAMLLCEWVRAGANPDDLTAVVEAKRKTATFSRLAYLRDVMPEYLEAKRNGNAESWRSGRKRGRKSAADNAIDFHEHLKAKAAGSVDS